jgi:hypothetical protein
MPVRLAVAIVTPFECVNPALNILGEVVFP